jgi:uncharacterized membrane protein
MKRAGMLLVLLAVVGLVDSLYLAKSKANGTPLLCNIENLSGCNIVADSPYSYLFGVSLAEMGIIFYVVVLLLALCTYVLSQVWAGRALKIVAVLGFLSSLYFILLQVFVIKALCLYCIISTLCTLGILLLAFRREAPKEALPDTL